MNLVSAGQKPKVESGSSGDFALRAAIRTGFTVGWIVVSVKSILRSINPFKAEKRQ